MRIIKRPSKAPEDATVDVKPDVKRARRDPPATQLIRVDDNSGLPPEAGQKHSAALPVRAKSFEFSAPAGGADAAANAAAVSTDGQHIGDQPLSNGDAAAQGPADARKHNGDLNGAEVGGGERLFGVPLPSSSMASGPGDTPALQASPRSAFSPTNGPAQRGASARAGPRLPDNLSPFTAMADGAADRQGAPTADASPPHRGEAEAAGAGAQDGVLHLSTIASLHSWGTASAADGTSAAENAAVALLSSRMRSATVPSEPFAATRHSPSLPQRASPRAPRSPPLQQPPPDVAALAGNALASALKRRDPSELSPVMMGTADGSPGPARPSVRRLSDPEALQQHQPTRGLGSGALPGFGGLDMAALAAAVRGSAPGAGSPHVSQQLTDLITAAARTNASPDARAAAQANPSIADTLLAVLRQVPNGYERFPSSPSQSPEAGGQPALSANEALLLATAGHTAGSGEAPPSGASLYSSLFERRGGVNGQQQQLQHPAWGSEKMQALAASLAPLRHASGSGLMPSGSLPESLGGVGSDGGTDAAVPDAQEAHYLGELRKFIKDKGGELGPGWTVRVRTRSVLLHGKERQQKDAFYCSPSGDTYNSRRKVAVAMGLMTAEESSTRSPSLSRPSPTLSSPGWQGGPAPDQLTPQQQQQQQQSQPWGSTATSAAAQAIASLSGVGLPAASLFKGPGGESAPAGHWQRPMPTWPQSLGSAAAAAPAHPLLNSVLTARASAAGGSGVAPGPQPPSPSARRLAAVTLTHPSPTARARTAGTSGKGTSSDEDDDRDRQLRRSSGSGGGGGLSPLPRPGTIGGGPGGRPGMNTVPGAVSKRGTRSARQQTLNKEAQKRYRERKREKSAAMEARIADLEGQLEALKQQQSKDGGPGRPGQPAQGGSAGAEGAAEKEALAAELVRATAKISELRGALQTSRAEADRLRTENELMLRDPLEPAQANGEAGAASSAAQRSDSLGEAVAGAGPATAHAGAAGTGTGEQSTQVKEAIKQVFAAKESQLKELQAAFAAEQAARATEAECVSWLQSKVDALTQENYELTLAIHNAAAAAGAFGRTRP